FHEAQDAPFRCRVAGAVFGAVLALHGRQYDDPAFAPGNQLRSKGAYGVGRSVEIVVDDVTPLDILHLEQWLPALDGGVGYHDIDLSIAFFHAIGDLPEGGDVTDIRTHALAFPPVLL